MYQVSYPQKYYIWDFRDKRYVAHFETVDELVDFIACGYRETRIWDKDFFNCKTVIENPFIDKCACSMNEGENRRYFIFDEHSRILNVRLYQDLAFAIYKKKAAEGGFNWTTYRIFYMKLNGFPSPQKMWWHKNTPEFRKGPVPGTGKWRGGPWQTRPHTFHIKKMYANPEFREYNRGSIREVPSWYDDRWRCNQRSWKSQSKKRHQWEK